MCRRSKTSLYQNANYVIESLMNSCEEIMKLQFCYKGSNVVQMTNNFSFYFHYFPYNFSRINELLSFLLITCTHTIKNCALLSRYQTTSLPTYHNHSNFASFTNLSVGLDFGKSASIFYFVYASIFRYRINFPSSKFNFVCKIDKLLRQGGI